MGDIADSIIDGDFDYITGEYLGEGGGFPRTFTHQGKRRSRGRFLSPSERKIESVRKELAILIQKKQALCSTEKQKNQALNDARQEINLKYGKGWRERGLIEGTENQWTEEELAPYRKK